MKYILIIFIGFCALVKAQNPLLFNKYYNTGYNNLQTAKIKFNNADSSYVALNYVRDSATSYQKLVLLKIDKFGNELLTKQFLFNYDYLSFSAGANQFVDCTNSSYLAVSTTYTSSNTTILITKINKQSLDTIKHVFFGDGIYDYYLSNILKINNNKFYLVGNQSNTLTSVPVFVEVDSNAIVKNIIASSFSYSLSTKSAYYDTLTKKIILSGWKYGSQDFHSFMAIADTLGNVLDTFINQSFNHGTSQLIYNKVDNHFYLLGNKTTGIEGNNKMNRLHVTKYDYNLNIIWQKTYGKANYINGIYDGTVNLDGSMVLVGRYSDSLNLPVKNVNCNAFMLKINTNGDSLWMRQFDSINNITGWNNNYFEMFNAIEKTPEGGYIMCGNAQIQPNAKAWVVKTDSVGCVLSNCSSTGLVSSNLVENSFSVYPNPASHKITIEIPLFDFAQSDKLSVIMTNAIGEVVQTKRLTQQATVINISQLSSGLYFVNLVNQNGNITTKKVVVLK